ncbi:unnamed protein product [Periconia digitata]|uniref:Uncharacterized protein n=1 Tax=Periconia digitata TaxID=1303443 RepID=A0A9W4XH53_9PLEO|nr:unnamed protein product [Periconia digitata]
MILSINGVRLPTLRCSVLQLLYLKQRAVHTKTEKPWDFQFTGKRRAQLAISEKEKHLKRLHKVVPWIESPLVGADQNDLVFSQRHEANTLELFFDLFFVANLATFTTYHSVTDNDYLIAYVSFFGILWSCWFQVTLHDVRFARDSLYERACKVIQLIVFVGLALVGSSFSPSGPDADNTNFRILCYTLTLSRFLLAMQYLVVLFYVFRAKYSKLYLPLSIMVALYGIAALVFSTMIAAFKEGHQAKRGVFAIWYVMMVTEALGAIAVSCIWRMLSFKKTHLMERMSLLTLIVIGEGAIGVTKTVSRLMGKYGLDAEGCFLIMCIICSLVLIWALYFDNFPHGHYGTIRQQIWSLLHFPFQLAIVGVVEGSQQIALARYVIRNWEKIEQTKISVCLKEHLDGPALRDALLKLLDYMKFNTKQDTWIYHLFIESFIEEIGNTTDICSPTNAATYKDRESWPQPFYNVTQLMYDGVYLGLGVTVPMYKYENEYVEDIAKESWKTVYLYYWTSVCLLIACSLVFLLLIRRHRIDIFDWVSVGTRIVAIIIGASLIGIIARYDTMYSFIRSSAILPIFLSLLFAILLFDKLSAVLANLSLKKSGQPYALEYEEEHHHHEHHDEHVELHNSSQNHPAHSSAQKSPAWTSYSEVTDEANSTEYRSVNGSNSYAMFKNAATPSPSMAPMMAMGPLGVHSGYTPVYNPS